MKAFSIFFSLASLLVLSASCSRHLSGTSSGSQLKTVSALENNKPEIRASTCEPTARIALAARPETSCPDEPKPSPELKNEPGKQKAVKNEVNTVRSLVTKQVSDLTILHKYISERGYPQINKAGLIFIAAAILGYFLHLILIACIIIGVIGLIVFLSPLFRRRY